VRSLTVKILLWFLAVMTFTAVAFVLTTAHIMSAPRGEHMFSRLLRFQAEEARYAYETGGRAALTAFLGRLERGFNARAALTDSQGRDVLTGENLDKVLASSREEYRVPEVSTRVLVRDTADGRYSLVLEVQRNRPAFSILLLPQYLWIVAVVALLSYVLAFHLTSPLRGLQKAVERFGHGELAARFETRRRDEFGRLSQSFNAMAGRIQRLLAAERRLLQDISHELRSPLARLAVAVELARSGEDRNAALDRIQKEADRLNALVGELLQVTRAEGDPAAMRREDVQLDELVREVAADCDLEARVRKCRVAPGAGGPVWVKGDPELLRRAVENVVRNAMRHAPVESPVEVTASADGGRVRVTVRDYGPGVPDEHLRTIFQPFFRVETDRGRSTGGAGLGLAIAQRAVELHHGSITARNATPGLLVEIDLPVNSYTPGAA
jgi:two-component system sensor histidine kinase CpxA